MPSRRQRGPLTRVSTHSTWNIRFRDSTYNFLSLLSGLARLLGVRLRLSRGGSGLLLLGGRSSLLDFLGLGLSGGSLLGGSSLLGGGGLLGGLLSGGLLSSGLLAGSNLGLGSGLLLLKLDGSRRT